MNNNKDDTGGFPFTRRKLCSLILIIGLLCSAFFAGQAVGQSGIGNQNYPTAYNSGGPTGAYDYLVFTFTNNTGTYYAAKDSFGRIVDSWTSTNKTDVMQNCVTALTGAGGTIIIRNLEWDNSVVVPSNVVVVDSQSNILTPNYLPSVNEKLYLPFEEGIGETTADRVLVDRGTFLAGNVSWAEGKVGNALEFSGEGNTFAQIGLMPQGELGNVLYEPNSDKPFKMWFGLRDNLDVGNGIALAFAYSYDGYNWEKVKCSGAVPVGVGIEDPYIVRNGTGYSCYYEYKSDGSILGVGLSTSEDGVNWVCHGVVLEASDETWENRDVSSPVVVILDNSTWVMLYEGRGTGGSNGIGLVSSTDGESWTRISSSPVMLNTDTYDNWVDGDMVPDDIVKIDSTYYMLYHGHVSAENRFLSGLAKSSDLLSWTDYANTAFDSSAMMFLEQDSHYSVIYYNSTAISVYKGYLYPSIPATTDIVYGTEPLIASYNNEDIMIFPDQGYTISAWVYFNEISKQRILTAVADYVFYIDKGGLIFEIINADGNAERFSSSVALLSADQWYHVAAVYDGEYTVQLYVDGVMVSSETREPFTPKSSIRSISFIIGAYDYEGTQVLNGKIDELRISNAALSQREIKTLYNYGLSGYQER